MAERWGFEPQIRYRMLPFQGSAIDHSAISPKRFDFLVDSQRVRNLILLY